MPQISIIVPVYNNEKYLKKCVDSILNQSFKSLEIILVDDGSTDASGKICDEYELKDDRVKVIHQHSGGVSKARNAGLDIAQGDFIGFVDSDDYLAPDMYEFLYRNLKTQNADISICGIINYFYNKENLISKVRQSSVNGFWVMTGKQAFGEALKSHLFSVNPVNKLFKKNLFDGMRYPEGKTSEDAFLIPEILLKASKVVYDSAVKYYYIRHENSITTSAFSKEDWSVVQAYKKHLETVNKYYPEFKKQAEFRYFWAFTYVLDKIVLSNQNILVQDYKIAASNIRKNALKIFLNPYFSLKRKLAVLIFLFSPAVYRWLICSQKIK